MRIGGSLGEAGECDLGSRGERVWRRPMDSEDNKMTPFGVLGTPKRVVLDVWGRIMRGEAVPSGEGATIIKGGAIMKLLAPRAEKGEYSGTTRDTCTPLIRGLGRKTSLKLIIFINVS